MRLPRELNASIHRHGRTAVVQRAFVIYSDLHGLRKSGPTLPGHDERESARTMQDLMKGKRGLIMGVANDHSIAWGIAKALAAQGAELAFTYQGEALGKRVKPLAQSLGVPTWCCPAMSRTSPASIRCSRRCATKWGHLDFLVHAIGFTDKNELQGPLCRHHAREFLAHDADLLLFLYRACQARRRTDAGGRRLDDHADLRRLDAGDAELQCDGGGEGGAGSFRALSRSRFRTAGASASMRSRPVRSARWPARASAMRARCLPSSRSIRRSGAA